MLATRLKEFRKIKNLNAEDLAKELEVKTSTIYNYESGYSKPNADILKIFLEKFNLNINWLLSGKGQIILENKNTFEIKQNIKNQSLDLFGDRLCELIKKSGLDSKTFAGITEIDYERLADLCIGAKEPQLKDIVSIAEYFNVTSDWLIFGE